MLSFYKTHPEVISPSYATEGSACFDLHAFLLPKVQVKFFNAFNDPVEFSPNQYGAGGKIALYSSNRVLIPTGLIFSMPVGYSVRIHPRSGVSAKQGLTLINCEGVVDSDYTYPVFIALYNASMETIYIANGDRIAQAELVKDTRVLLNQIDSPPSQVTDRTGGFGSTGT